jgi:hypothetical protein
MPKQTAAKRTDRNTLQDVFRAILLATTGQSRGAARASAPLYVRPRIAPAVPSFAPLSSPPRSAPLRFDDQLPNAPAAPMPSRIRQRDLRASASG